MRSPDLSDTQPRRIEPSTDKRKGENSAFRQTLNKIPWKWVGIIGAVLLIVVSSGAWMGWSSARRSQLDQQASQTNLTLDQQYDLGLEDLSSARYDVAIQRFEYILSQDPGYPGATDRLVEAMGVLYSTATPTPLAPTATPTPTADPRPVQELFQSALQLAGSQDWTGTIESLTALRKADRSYMAARVDGLLYLSLRSRGVQKIYKERNLQGGIYDLAVAEKFGPIDSEANNARNLARLYLYGVSFWEVDWAKAVEYFSQVASALPNLTDASGLSAGERYRVALINYADQLAAQEDWCNAQTQYEQALAIRPESAVEEKLETVRLLCLGPSETATITGETPTPSTTPTGPVATATATQPMVDTPTATQSSEPPTVTQPAATEPATQAPTATQPEATPYPAPATQETGNLIQETSGLVGMLVAGFWLGFTYLRARTLH